jgi:hypothetical protein
MSPVIQEMTMVKYFSQHLGHLAGFTLFSVILSSNALAQSQYPFSIFKPSLQSIPSSTSSEAVLRTTHAGLQFDGSQALNEGQLVSLTGTKTDSIIRSVERCVGTLHVPSTYDTYTSQYTTPGIAKARFLSKKVAPAPGLRVVIRNTTTGIDQQSNPYTDREYIRNDYSEPFVVKQGISHSHRYLAVVPGINTFAYQVRQGNKVVESGVFTATISVATKADEPPTGSRFDSNAPLVNSPNPCDPAPEISPTLPDIQPLIDQYNQIPEIPPIPPDIQQLIDQYKP